jgi:hypothetical protein
VLQKLLQVGARALSDHLHGATVRKVADVAREAQEAGARQHVVAEADALDTPTDNGAEGD